MNIEYCGNTADDIMLELSTWQVEGEMDGDEQISPEGCFYQEAVSEIKSALIKGNFPQEPGVNTPIARQYIAAIHRKMTALLYLQAHRLNLLSDGSDQTRGMWSSIRKKLADISRGEAFGELKTPRISAQTSSFVCCNECRGMSVNRGL